MGFATVVRSAARGVAEGLRVYGFLPMSTHVELQLAASGRRPDVFVDAAAHRAGLSATYNSYSAMPDDPLDDHRAALRSLFSTSFLLDEELADGAPARTALLSSASSKTAMGLAWLLRRRGVDVVGLTSANRITRLAQHGLYDRLTTYDEFGDQGLDGPVAFVDFAGNPKVVEAVHRQLAGRLARSVAVGFTHWEAPSVDRDLPGPPPTMFFAPDRVRVLAAAIGGRELLQRMDTGLREFVAANPWLRVVEHAGPEALQAVYATVIEGRAVPEDLHIVRPGGTSAGRPTEGAPQP